MESRDICRMNTSSRLARLRSAAFLATPPPSQASLIAVPLKDGTVTHWTLQDAKNRFSAVVRDARTHGPQRITLHGKDAVVVLAVEEYEKLVGLVNLVDALRDSPLATALAAGELTLDRPRDLGREVEL
jgi:prevent-host-death family protein